MKKRDLLLAGAMLFGFGATTQAQEQLFFFGFEDGMASFTDSTNALDSITSLQYYAEPGANGTHNPDEWELGPTFDTLIYVLNGLQPLTSRGDVAEIVEDLEGEHAGEFANMGAQGGERFFRYTAGNTYTAPSGQNPPEGECLDYEANLFVRALPIKPNTSYRLSMYTKSNSENGIMTIDLMSGFYNSESPFSMNGESGGEFRLVKRGFTTDRWERVTMMSYYQNDSIANRHTYQRGYWWVDSWNKVDSDGNNYNFIVIPSQYFVRLSFTGHNATYYVDDMALTESWIAGAEYYKNIMRVNFGYDTNLQELAAASSMKALEFPAENIVIKGVDTYLEKEIELVIESAEYHDDGYLYIWIDPEDDFEFYENVKVSFTNPEDEALQLEYDGDLYPMALDTNWVNAGKIVPDFEGEPAFFNPSVYALSMKEMAPVYLSSEPENGSFSLPTTTTSFDVTFNKEIYVEVEEYDPADTTSVIAVMRGSGGQEVWIPTAYNEETFTVTFSRQSSNTAPLAGDYEFDIVQARATSRSPQAAKKTIALSFGTSDEAAETLVDLKFDDYENGTSEIEGLSVNAACMMAVTNFTGAYEKALKFGLYGVSLGSGAPVMTYTFNVEKTGMAMIKFGTSGCLKNSWNDGCKMVVALIDPSGNEIASYTEEGTDNKPEEGGNVDKADDLSLMANLSSSGEYKLTFTLPNEQSYGGGHQGGRVLYYINIVKQPAAYSYNKMYTDAMDAANAVIAKSDANSNYSGSYLDEFKALIASKEGFSSTAPSAYNKTVAEIEDGTAAMNTRIANVDNYYTAYNASIGIDTLYQDSLGYNELVAYAAVKKAVADYASLDVTVKNNDDLNAITAEITAINQAMTDRCAAIDEFNANIYDAEDIFANQSSLSMLAEYKALQDAYNANKDLAKFAVTDDELKAANEAISSAISTFNSKLAAAGTLTAQVKGLAEMAEALVSDWGTVDTEELAAQLAAELEDNQALAGVYQAAIKAALEEMMAADGIDEAGIDMTYFLQNNGFYTLVTGNETRVQKAGDHKETAFPGWTIISASGNAYIDQTATAEAGVVSTQIALDWNSAIEMSQTLGNLPAGKYAFGHTYSNWTEARAGEIVFIQYDADDNVVMTDTMTWNTGDPMTDFMFEYTGSKLEIKANLKTTTGWSFVDNFSLYLMSAIEGYDYAAAAEASKVALGEAYTGVGSIEAPSKVQYYNLNGMQVAEPNAGVNIRISTGADGQRVIEKVLIK